MKNTPLAYAAFAAMAVMATLTLSACDHKKPAEPTTAPKPVVLNVGQVESVRASAMGIGATLGAATSNALKNAIEQVNGVRIEDTSAEMHFYNSVTERVDTQSDQGSKSNEADITVKSAAFAQAVVSQSQGQITSFKVVKINEPGMLSKKDAPYSVIIEAQITKYKAAPENGRLKIVIAPLHSDASTFDIGGKRVPAQPILDAIHSRLVDALTQTGRFIVLDRDFNQDLQGEFNLIDAGQTNNADYAKLNQALSADVVWVGRINQLEYKKNVQQLQTSDRSLVSYAGGWSFSQRLIGLAQQQILLSNTLRGAPRSIAPTTLGTNFNADKTLTEMEDALVRQAAQSVIFQLFPISVVEMDGNKVILSQGGALIAANARYHVFLQGKEMKDPQTGQSLGRDERDCCEIHVDRVTPKMAYGTLENVQINLKNITAADLLIKGAALSGHAAKQQPEQTAHQEPVNKAALSKAKVSKTAPPSERKGQDSSANDDW